LTDGIWDHGNAYKERVCYRHGEKKWLLGNLNRWMRPSDFKIPGAEAKLNVKLEEEYGQKQWEV
jgi:hypothetical protein